jgi:hypothetical protein
MVLSSVGAKCELLAGECTSCKLRFTELGVRATALQG